MIFSKRLKDLRTEKGLTQDQLSEKTGLSHGCIAMLEVEKRSPTAQTLNILADFFQCTTDYLLGREDDFGNVTLQQSSTVSLPNNEQALLDNYRKLPADLQHHAAHYVQRLAELQEEELADTFPTQKDTKNKRILKNNFAKG